jgi:hypothetical protein
MNPDGGVSRAQIHADLDRLLDVAGDTDMYACIMRDLPPAIRHRFEDLCRDHLGDACTRMKFLTLVHAAYHAGRES